MTTYNTIGNERAYSEATKSALELITTTAQEHDAFQSIIVQRKQADDARQRYLTSIGKAHGIFPISGSELIAMGQAVDALKPERTRCGEVVTWDMLTKHEPRLLHVEALVTGIVHEYTSRGVTLSDAAKKFWYGYTPCPSEYSIKGWILDLVGWDSFSPVYELRTTTAWDVAYDHLYDTLTN